MIPLLCQKSTLDAVRQYLATGSGGDSIFDQMLGEIVPEDEEQPQLPASSSGFDELVNSMRRDQTHTPLPDRHQQFVEFILKGGMDGLLSEIEKTQTDKLDSPQAAPEERRERSTFEKLAAEEPPPPTLEESGTVGDLMVGVSDTSFRNVLSMMRGEEIAPPSEAAEAEDDYAAFFDSEVGLQASAPAHDQAAAARSPEPRFEPWVPEPEEEEDDSSIPAQLILETTLDELTPPEAFSINNLLGSIEQQLTEHKPDIRPLPSWPVDLLQPKSPDRKRQRRRKRGESDLYIREPDFLPEEFLTPAAAREVEPAASSPLFEEPAAVEEPEINAAELSMFEELGEAISEAPVEPETPRIVRLADTRPVEPIREEELGSFDEAAAELPPLEEEAADLNTMETVLGEMAAAQAKQRVPPVDEIDWDAEPSWQEPAWEEADEMADMEQEAEAPAASLPTFEDDWSLTIDEASGELTEVIERVEDQEQPVAFGVGADSQTEAQVFQLADQDDPYIAQIALSLTQVSLELAAEATLLTNDEEIVAIAGELEPDDVEEIRDAIADDWDANPNEARVRFITLASSGKDYMLYSRKTVGDFTLSMIFSGTTPLRDIRRQGKRLVESLEAVPDLVAQHEVPELVKGTDEVSAVPAPPTGETALQPFTYLWLLNNPDFAFGQNTARAITAGLSLQLGELGWQVKSLQTEGEYIYLRADIPGERAPHEIIQDLKRRAAEIAQAQQPDLDRDNLWADSYLVMMPGRELDPDEINQFINFERMF